MDSIEIPRRFRDHSSRFASQPPLSDEEAREKKEIFSRQPGMAVENNRVRWMISLTQVYSLQFLSFGADHLHQLYGTIRFGRACVAQMIFDRQIGKGSDHDIDEKGYARLSGPMRPMNGDTSVVVYPRLFKKNETQGRFHPARIDEILSFDRGKIPFPENASPAEESGITGKWLLTERDLDDDMLDEFPDLQMPHNKVLRQEVETTVGPIAVTFSVFRDGMEAFVRIKLLKWGANLGQSANVYGTICASTAMLNDPDAKSYILDLKRDEHTSVKAHQFIPLQRPSTAVPHGHKFKLDICIMHRDLISGKDKVVAKDCLEFTPQCSFKGSDEYIREPIDVSGDFSLVQVEVFWSPWWSIYG